METDLLVMGGTASLTVFGFLLWERLAQKDAGKLEKNLAVIVCLLVFLLFVFWARQSVDTLSQTGGSIQRAIFLGRDLPFFLKHPLPFFGGLIFGVLAVPWLKELFPSEQNGQKNTEHFRLLTVALALVALSAILGPHVPRLVSSLGQQGKVDIDIFGVKFSASQLGGQNASFSLVPRDPQSRNAANLVSSSIEEIRRLTVLPPPHQSAVVPEKAGNQQENTHRCTRRMMDLLPGIENEWVKRMRTDKGIPNVMLAHATLATPSILEGDALTEAFREHFPQDDLFRSHVVGRDWLYAIRLHRIASATTSPRTSVHDWSIESKEFYEIMMKRTRNIYCILQELDKTFVCLKKYSELISDSKLALIDLHPLILALIRLQKENENATTANRLLDQSLLDAWMGLQEAMINLNNRIIILARINKDDQFGNPVGADSGINFPLDEPCFEVPSFLEWRPPASPSGDAPHVEECPRGKCGQYSVRFNLDSHQPYFALVIAHLYDLIGSNDTAIATLLRWFDKHGLGVESEAAAGGNRSLDAHRAWLRIRAASELTSLVRRAGHNVERSREFREFLARESDFFMRVMRRQNQLLEARCERKAPQSLDSKIHEALEWVLLAQRVHLLELQMIASDEFTDDMARRFLELSSFDKACFLSLPQFAGGSERNPDGYGFSGKFWLVAAEGRAIGRQARAARPILGWGAAGNDKFHAETVELARLALQSLTDARNLRREELSQMKGFEARIFTSNSWEADRARALNLLCLLHEGSC